MITVVELLRSRVEADADRLFLQEVGGRTQTLQEFYRDCLRWADALETLGVERGAPVATLIGNSARSFHSYVGTSLAGAVEVPLNPELRGGSLVHALNSCRADTLVAEARFTAPVAEVIGQLTHLRRVVIFDLAAAAAGLDALTTIDADAVLAASTARDRRPPRPEDPAVVIFTSGTTGPAKAVVKPWSDMLQFSRDWWHGEPSREYDDGGYYQIWPTFHMSGKSALAFCLDARLRMVIRERFSLSRFWDDVRSAAISHAAFIFILPVIMNVPPAPDDADNPLEVAEICPLTPSYRRFQERFGLRRIITGWGMTEAGQPIGTAHPANGRTCGRPYPGAEVMLVDEAGEPVPDDTPGELLVRRSATRANGYYLGLPEATAKAWRDGWMHTGDIFVRDSDGNYYFVDRKKDALRRRGENISSLEVESEVLAHPDVVECACVGVPWDFASAGDEGTRNLEDEEIKVFVRLRDGANITPADLIAFLEPRMPTYMLPRYVSFVPELPKTPTGKVVKEDLRSRSNAGVWDREAQSPRHSPASGSE